MRIIVTQVNASLILLVNENVALRTCHSSKTAPNKKLRNKRVVIGRQPPNSMKRYVKDKLWIFSDKKLLTTDQRTNRRADRFIKDCAEEVLWSCRANISRG